MSVDHAEDTLYNALKLDPANALTYRRLAGLYARNGTYKSAVVSLRAALELRPVDAEAYHELGVLLYRAAERVVWQGHKEAPRIKPKPRRVPGDELTCWRSRLEPCFPVAGYGSRLDVAEEEMTERIGKDGSDTRAYLNLGTILRNQSMAAAIAAIRLRPTFGTAYLTVARNLQKGGSLGVYRRAIALLPKEPHVYLWYGEALDSVRYYKQANRAYKQAVALDPAMLEGYASSRFSLGVSGHVGPRKAMFDSIRCGALLLFASDHTPLPFSDEIDYDAFALRVPEGANVNATVAAVGAIPAARLRRMAAAMARAAPLLDYRDGLVDAALRHVVKVAASWSPQNYFNACKTPVASRSPRALRPVYASSECEAVEPASASIRCQDETQPI